MPLAHRGDDGDLCWGFLGHFVAWPDVVFSTGAVSGNPYISNNLLTATGLRMSVCMRQTRDCSNVQKNLFGAKCPFSASARFGAMTFWSCWPLQNIVTRILWLEFL